jgi:hypothetical protein
MEKDKVLAELSLLLTNGGETKKIKQLQRELKMLENEEARKNG